MNGKRKIAFTQMSTASSLLQELEFQMRDIGLLLMALRLDELYRSSEFLTMDRLNLVSALLEPEYQDKTSKRINNRLRNAKLIGTPCDIGLCRDSDARKYEPAGSPQVLSSLRFIEDGLNVCILGPSDSGKTFLAKALGAAACEKYRVRYSRCSELLESLVSLKNNDYPKFQREIKRIMSFDLFILDDFLLNTIMDEREVKVLMEIMEKRLELAKSTIVCSQRDPKSWQAMIMNDEVSANALLKRATKHYVIVIRSRATTPNPV